MATPPTPIAGALTINASTGVILSPVTADLFKSANGIGSGSGDVTASGVLTATRLILGNGTTSVTASDLSYSTPTLTVPDGFGITGVGSLALTAGGSNKNITLTPSGTGGVFSLRNFNVYRDDADSTDAVQTFTSFVSAVSMRSTLTNQATTASLILNADAGANNTAAFIDFRIRGTSRVKIGALSQSAWGVTGARAAFSAGTTTDTSSSGTVASAVANSFAVPTFAASSATTFTNAANLYIAGDVAAGSNVTLTNSYGLWNVGKTRLDGPLTLTPAALTYASPTSVNVNSATVFTVTTVNATGSVTFNASGAGRAGQPMTIIITNDASSAKTITFGTNFKSTGTLTASAASRQTTITFVSDGTNFCETGRAVLNS